MKCNSTIHSSSLHSESSSSSSSSSRAGGRAVKTHFCKRSERPEHEKLTSASEMHEHIKSEKKGRFALWSVRLVVGSPCGRFALRAEGEPTIRQTEIRRTDRPPFLPPPSSSLSHPPAHPPPPPYPPISICVAYRKREQQFLSDESGLNLPSQFS